MLSVEMTEHLLGIRIYGDYDALDELYDAVFELADAGEAADMSEAEAGMRTRVLALCYDLRHAYQGDRGIKMVSNGMDADHETWAGVKVPAFENVIYYVEVLYPEAMYEMLCLNWLIERWQAKLLGKGHMVASDVSDQRILFDAPCARVRFYQSLVMEAVRAKTSPNTFSRIHKQVAGRYFGIAEMYPQWVDIINGDWMAMTVKRREKGLSTVVRDLANYWLHEQYHEVKADIDQFIQETGALLNNVSVNIDYPDEYEW